MENVSLKFYNKLDFSNSKADLKNSYSSIYPTSSEDLFPANLFEISSNSSRFLLKSNSSGSSANLNFSSNSNLPVVFLNSNASKKPNLKKVSSYQTLYKDSPNPPQDVLNSILDQTSQKNSNVRDAINQFNKIE